VIVAYLLLFTSLRDSLIPVISLNRQESLGERVHRRRRLLRISQVELAGTRLDDSYVSLIENDKRYPPPRVVVFLAERLRCSVEYLETGISDERVAELRTMVGYARIVLENGDANEAVRQFVEALADLDLSLFPGLVDEARRGHARALEANGDLAGAVTALRDLISAVDATDTPDRWCDLHIGLCRCLRELGDENESIRVGEAALRRLTDVREGPWTDAMVMLGSTILAAYGTRGDLMYARYLASRLICEADANGHPRARMAAHWNAAEVAMASGDAGEALRLATTALALLGEEDDPRNMGRLRTAYGYFLLSAEPAEAGRARHILRQAERELAASSASTVDMAWCLTVAARAELILDCAAEAVALAEHAITLLNGTDGLALAEAYTVLANAWVRLRRHDAAVTALDHAAGYLTATGRQAAQVWYEMAGVRAAAHDTNGQAAALRYAMACMGV